jgi:hypothetical protein
MTSHSVMSALLIWSVRFSRLSRAAWTTEFCGSTTLWSLARHGDHDPNSAPSGHGPKQAFSMFWKQLLPLGKIINFGLLRARLPGRIRQSARHSQDRVISVSANMFSLVRILIDGLRVQLITFHLAGEDCLASPYNRTRNHQFFVGRSDANRDSSGVGGDHRRSSGCSGRCMRIAPIGEVY